MDPPPLILVESQKLRYFVAVKLVNWVSEPLVVPPIDTPWNELVVPVGAEVLDLT